jgi:hypothetical protein
MDKSRNLVRVEMDERAMLLLFQYFSTKLLTRIEHTCTIPVVCTSGWQRIVDKESSRTLHHAGISRAATLSCGAGYETVSTWVRAALLVVQENSVYIFT